MSLTFRIAGLVLASAVAAGCGSSAPPAADTATTPAPATSSPSTPPPAPLDCSARVTVRHPEPGQEVGIAVSTAAHARVIASAVYAHSTRHHEARASAAGRHTFRFAAGTGRRVPVTISVARGARSGSCETTLRARRPPSPTPPASAPPTPAPPPPPATSAPPTTAACYPTSAAGNCYRAGEFCSDADHGMHGIDADGDPIVCEDNNGWRWEPA